MNSLMPRWPASIKPLQVAFGFRALSKARFRQTL
jgi:hypothetical protein